MKLEALIDELENYIPALEQKNAKVSNSTVGWQIAHSLKVVKGIVQTLKNSKPEEYQPKFSPGKILILTLGRLPRGVGKAPKIVLPNEEEVTKEGLQQALQATRASLKEIQALPDHAHFKHPMFGGMKKKTALRFLAIHTIHHVRIIRDMLKKK